MKDFINKYKVLIIALICLLGFLLILSKFSSSINNDEDAFKKYNKKTEIREDSEKDYVEEDKKEEILVYIGGAVVEPNVYKLSEGSRIKDLVHLAGGFLDNAESKNINLAQKLNDEDYIYVYAVGENEIDSNTIENKDMIHSSNIKVNIDDIEEMCKIIKR